MNKAKLLYKKDNTIFLALLIIILECFTMISTPYSKSILPLQHLNSVIWLLVMFTIFFAVFSGYVIFNFTKLRIVDCKKEIAISFCIMLLLRLVLDFICSLFYFTEMIELCVLIIDYIFYAVLFQLLMYVYAKNNFVNNVKQAFVEKDKTIIVLVLAYILTFVISNSLLFAKLFKLYLYREKYNIQSQFYVFQQANTFYESHLLRMIAAIISEIILILLLNCLFGEKTIKSESTFLRVTARSMISVVLVTVLFFVKIIVLPTGSIKNINSEISNAYVGLENLTSNSFTQKQIYRANGIKQEVLCYEKTEIETKYHNDSLITFKLCNFFDYEYVNAEANNIKRANGGASVKIDGQEIVFFANQYVVFVENGTPYVIAFEDIKNQGENDVLTSFIKYMVSCGYWDYFEYGCDYMQKYDADFIKPYIERYANGDFTENEINENLEINKDYMISFAKGKLY